MSGGTSAPRRTGRVDRSSSAPQGGITLNPTNVASLWWKTALSDSKMPQYRNNWKQGGRGVGVAGAFTHSYIATS